MARIPKPTSMHEASGAFDHDPQRRRAREHEPIPTGPLGDPPSFLSPAECAIWHELAEQAPPGVLTISDRIMVEMVSRLLARDRDPELRKVDPLKSSDRNLIISCLARMGMSAADRSKIAVANPRGPEDPADAFSQLAARPRGRDPEDIKQ